MEKKEEQKKEEQKDVNLEAEFQDAMRGMMEYLRTTNPQKIDELGEVYDLVSNYKADPENYMKKEIPIEYYIQTQKSENWFDRHMKNIESFGDKVKDSITEGIEKMKTAFK